MHLIDMEQLSQSITLISEKMSISTIDSNIKCVISSYVRKIKGCYDCDENKYKV